MFIHFDTIHKRVRHTDRPTDRQTPHDGIGRIAQQKIDRYLALSRKWCNTEP